MADSAINHVGADAGSLIDDVALTGNDATRISTYDNFATVLMRALREVQTGAVQICPSHSASNERGELQLSILLQYEGTSVLHTLSKEERNFLARKNPSLLIACLSNAQRQIADQEGFRNLEDCSISWGPSFIPFHLAYSIVQSGVKCQHLGSVRNLKTRDPQQYAEDLMPLARSFLAKPHGTRSPHLPFTWASAQSSSVEPLGNEDSKTQKTIEHGQLIVTRFKTLQDIDLTTAEATAKLINENKIIPGLLKLLFDPGLKKLEAPSLAHSDSDTNRRAAIQGLKNKPKRSDSRIVKPQESARQGMDNGRSGLRKVESEKANHNRTSYIIAGGRRSFASFQTDSGKGLVELSGAVTNGNATRKIRETRPHPVPALKAENPPRKGTRSAAVRPANSKKRPNPTASKSKPTHASKGSLSREEDHCQNAKTDPPIPSAESAQMSQPTLHKAIKATRPGRGSAPPLGLEDCAHPSVSELSLPGAAHGPETLKYSRKRGLRDELSDLISDALDACGATQSYHPENELLLSKAVESSNKPNGKAYDIDMPGITPVMGGGSHELKWAYATHTDADEALLDARVWLWERPPTYFYPHQVSIKMSNPYILAPVVVSHESTGTCYPLIEYSGDIIHIVPHDEPWEDARSMECHPDFVPPCKLVEYQACEAAGYYVWRHDRDRLPCRKPDCDALVFDHNPSSVFCQGCGPKTVVRYCSFQHQIEDIQEHWMECGDPSLVMQCVIDHATAPEDFVDKIPAIIDRYGKYGFRNAELYRQKTYFMRHGGHYTLFDPDTQDPKVLCWSKADPDWQEMDGWIERLLNLAFFGIRNRTIIEYIYSLLRELLRRSKEWTDRVQEMLSTQIQMEFQYPLLYVGAAPCDCEWAGRESIAHDQPSACGQGCIPATDPQLLTAGLERWVERMENRYWILRAWRQQHPTETDWRVRANGYGIIPLKPGDEIYQLGPRWTGWGGREGNIRGPDGVLNQELRKRFSGL